MLDIVICGTDLGAVHGFPRLGQLFEFADCCFFFESYGLGEAFQVVTDLIFAEDLRLGFGFLG